MLPLAVVQDVRRLLDEGKLSQRKIAQQLKVSRGTVAAIASGRRGLFGREPEDETPSLTCFDRPPERCPGCGALVYMPCLLCQARAYQARQTRIESLRPRQTLTPKRVA